MTLVVFAAAIPVCGPACAAGETGGIGITEEFLLMLLLYPVLAVGLCYILFRALGQGWMLFLAPLFYRGLTLITAVDPGDPSAAPGLFSIAGLWLYWTHLAGVAVFYPLVRRTRKSWLFLLAPLATWVMQFLILVIFEPKF